MTRLNFAALDDLAFAATRGKLSGKAFRPIVACDLGPLVELRQLTASGVLPAPEQAGWKISGDSAAFYNELASGRTQWLCPDRRHLGFLRTAGTPPADETTWTAFGLAAQRAAAAAGFAKPIAAQLSAALGELHSNIYEHSGASQTGLVAFRAQDQRFEAVVADHGIGVLNSLRENAEYAMLKDYGEALRLILTDGVSRFCSASSRGYGFRPLFIGLANLNGQLRFRSGDHALLIDGRKPSLVSAQLAEKPEITGFLASVVCEPIAPSSRQRCAKAGAT